MSGRVITIPMYSVSVPFDGAVLVLSGYLDDLRTQHAEAVSLLREVAAYCQPMYEDYRPGDEAFMSDPGYGIYVRIKALLGAEVTDD